ncbi:MAG TPA: VWA domain-containing protein [Gemmatimonadaceae bacterium]|nr:VWA domain-containing protein [Gemmatimonadaceae bacterium]
MEFLAPAWLAAAAAIAVPLLLHLMRRRIGTRIDFPAVRYLARAEREHSRKLRMRNLLLMLLRVAAVLILTAAAARPIARLAGGGHAPTSVAIVLDNSLSSSAIENGRPVLDELRARAREVVSRASGEDRLFLVTADAVSRGGGRGAMLDAIDHVEPLAGAGDLERAVARAAALVRQGPASARWMHVREIVIITDAQASTWRRPVSLGDVRVILHRAPGSPPENRAVSHAEARPVRWTPRGAVVARFRGPDTATYRFTLEGRTLARGTAARDEEVIVRVSPPEQGWTAGTVELEPDEMRGDDVRHFTAWIGPAPGIAVHREIATFAQSAVDALRQTERVVAGSDVSIAPADVAVRLPALLFAPADPVRAGAANRVLERLGVPWRLGALRQGEIAARGTAEGVRPLDGVMVARRHALRPVGGATADTIAMAGAEPWIVGGPGYVLVASPLTPDATSLPVRAAFIPWLTDVVTQRLFGDAGTVVHASPGAAIARPDGIDALEIPGGRRVTLAADTVIAPDRTGVAFFMRGGRRVGALVVNPEPDESDLARLTSDALVSRVRAAEVVSPDSARWTAALFSSSPRRSLLVPVLVLALAVLLLESAVAGAGQRRAA